MADQKQIEAYLTSVVEAAQKDPDSLERTELKLVQKYLQSRNTVEEITKDLKQLNQQIDQAKARVGSMETRVQGELGKAAGFAEALVALKFDMDEEEPAPKKTNGKIVEDPTETEAPIQAQAS